jgi:hypothetical protein
MDSSRERNAEKSDAREQYGKHGVDSVEAPGSKKRVISGPGGSDVTIFCESVCAPAPLSLRLWWNKVMQGCRQRVWGEVPGRCVSLRGIVKRRQLTNGEGAFFKSSSDFGIAISC